MRNFAAGGNFPDGGVEVDFDPSRRAQLAWMKSDVLKRKNGARKGLALVS